MNAIQQKVRVSHTGAHSVLLITTRNRYTGEPNSHLMAYRQEGDDYIIAARNETENYKPDWYLNLKEEPIVMLEVDGVTFHARASTPIGTDRVRLWPLVEEISGTNHNVLPRDTTIVVLTPIR